MILYDYFRSSASYRVRIALRLKGIDYKTIPVSLLDEQQHQADYQTLNPQQLVPTLDENGHILTQSLAIIEYLEDLYPTPSLLPKTPYARAQVRSLASFIACEMHPLNNLRTRQQLQAQFKADEHAIKIWCQHWLKIGFDALEKQLQKTSQGQYCLGEQFTLADVCLIPQVYSAQRFQFALQGYPVIQNIYTHCLSHPAFTAPLE